MRSAARSTMKLSASSKSPLTPLMGKLGQSIRNIGAFQRTPKKDAELLGRLHKLDLTSLMTKPDYVKIISENEQVRAIEERLTSNHEDCINHFYRTKELVAEVKDELANLK